MKTSLRIRIIMMSLVALVALSFASKTFAAVNAYIIFTDADDKTSKVTVANDGTFKTSAMKAGRVKVQFFWDRSSSNGAKSGTLTVSASPGGTAQAASKSGPFTVTNTGDAPTGSQRESSAPSVSEISMTYEIQAPRDAQSGMASGKRQHQPPMNIKLSSSERLLPTVNKKLGSIEIDKNCDGITGKIEIKDQNGKTMAMDDWHQ